MTSAEFAETARAFDNDVRRARARHAVPLRKKAWLAE